MIDMLPIDACMFEPPFQWLAVHERRSGAATEFPSDADVEAERKDLVELFSRNIFSTNDGTARAVVVMAERKTTHGVTCGSREPTQREPGKYRAETCGALLSKEKRDR